MASSGTVTANVSSVLAAQYNNLRDDVLNISTGHIHSGSADCGKQLESASYGALSVLQAAVQRGALWMLTRQGGHVDEWGNGGTINYGVATTGMDGHLVVTGGKITVTIAAGDYSAATTVTFPAPFAYSPLLYASSEGPLGPVSTTKALPTVAIYWTTEQSVTQADIEVGRPFTLGTASSAAVQVNWLAIGIQA